MTVPGRADQREGLAERARADATQAALDARGFDRTRPPSNVARQLAAEVGHLLGVEIDPRAVRDLGWQSPYYVGEVDVAGLTFAGRYLQDTNGLHRTVTGLCVRRRVKRIIGWRTETREVFRIGDLDGWL